MNKTLTALLFLILFNSPVHANDYTDAWTAIRQKNFTEAKKLLVDATKDPQTSLNAYMTLLYLQTYLGNEDEIPGLLERLSQEPDKNSYLFASWFNGSMLGQYGKKEDHQLRLLEKILKEGSFNGSIEAAAHYVKAMHHLYSNDISRARQEWEMVGSIQEWQLTGPFENISGSGFNAKHGPITSADLQTKFKGSNNIHVNWFTPSRINKEGWTFTYAHLPFRTAIIYAQAFVYAPEDMDVLLNAGGNGSLKIWVNDGLVLTETKERATELDYYKNFVKLKKGYNRLLVQLGYTNNTFPNFIVRFTDKNLEGIKGIKSTTEFQPYQKAVDLPNTSSLKFFAEEFFEKRIESDPGNPVNYILLSQVYLRNQRTIEARRVIEKALAISPENPLLKFELIQCLLKSENRTRLLQEVDWLKQNDPESYLNYQLSISNLISEEKYTDANDELDKMIALYGEDENLLKTRIQILGELGKTEELLREIKRAHDKYPENSSFLTMTYNVKKMVQKDQKGAMAIYEKYLKKNYNYSILSELAGEYKELGQNDKYLKIIEKLYDLAGYDPDYASTFSTYYFQKRNYSKALEYAMEALSLAPYTGTNWYNIALINEEMNLTDEAIKNYSKAIYYDRTNYEARKKLITLQKSTDPVKLLPETEVYSLIKNTPVDKDHDYTYLLDEKGTIIYDVGASEEYITYVVKLNNEKGIDAWKEIYLSYSGSQSLLVEKTEVVKSNGSRFDAERNDDHVVFTGLEAGDAIYVRYRVQNYSEGRLGSEFWDKFIFNSFAPSLTAGYTLVVANKVPFNSKVINSDLKPTVTESGGYKIYRWEAKNLPALKSEALMPPLSDVAAVIHISTLNSWSEVAEWYSDICYQDYTGNFELEELYKEIFKDNKKRSQLEKARMIYDYLITNIRYSSVSFLQSGLVPKDISETISTKLGDCKDLSTLFVALASKAGIPAQLVLIDTRDNGAYDMVLPTMGFNHCIAVATIDGKDYYLELTDSNLPFGSLGNNLYSALSLRIPAHGKKSDADLKPLYTSTRTPDKSIRDIHVSINGRDVVLDVDLKKFGNLSGYLRQSYRSMSFKDQMEEFEQSLSNGNKNPVKLESLSFTGLDELKDSVGMKYKYSIKNEVIEAGSMKMIKVPFIDIVATLENVSLDKRNFQVEYWKYENTDLYETSVFIEIPEGEKFIEIPSDVDLSFKGSTYSLKFAKVGNGLKVTRKAKLDRKNILPADYAQFKKFFNDIVEAESKYVVFK